MCKNSYSSSFWCYTYSANLPSFILTSLINRHAHLLIYFTIFINHPCLTYFYLCFYFFLYVSIYPPHFDFSLNSKHYDFAIVTPESGINIPLRLLIFVTFFQGLWSFSYSSSISIRYKWSYAYSFCQILQGLRLFKGVCLFFLPNSPGATFIQGGTFIPDSRVIKKLTNAFLVRFWLHEHQ